jgi:hypothetical protein
MRERKLPKRLRHDLRLYFETARHVREVNDDANLLESMSPLLQGRVAFAANREWLERVWYLARLPDTRDTTEFIAAVAKSLTVRAYVAEERAPIGQLYVLRKGIAVKNWRFMRAGMVWGDDIIIDALHLMDHSQAVALTYIEVFVLTREALDVAAEAFSEAQAIVDHAARRIRLQRALLVYFCERMGSKPRSFIRAKDAAGYHFVANQMSVEQKVDALHSAFVEGGELRIASRVRAPGASPTEQGDGNGGRPHSLSAMLRMPSATFSAADSVDITRLLADATPASHGPPPFATGAHGAAPAAAAKDGGGGGAAGSWWGGGGSSGSEKPVAETAGSTSSELAELKAKVQSMGTTVDKLATHAQLQTALLARLDLFLSQQGAGSSFTRTPSGPARTPAISAFAA